MTAGAGVIHSEMPAREFARDGGRMHGFQLWVNLPKRDKMMTPRYQEIPNLQIPKATSGDGLVTVNVIAGEAMGKPLADNGFETGMVMFSRSYRLFTISEDLFEAIPPPF